MDTTPSSLKCGVNKMPSVSDKQEKLMRAVAHDPKFAHKVGIPQSVGQEFNDADQAKKKKRQTK